MKRKNPIVVSSLVFLGFIGSAVLAGGPPTEPQVEEATTDPGVVISAEELMDMMYANDPNGSPGLTEDGGIPLTYEMLTQIAFRSFPIPADEDALSPSESLDTEESENGLSIPVSPEQAIELMFFGGATMHVSTLPRWLQLAVTGATVAPSDEEIEYTDESVEELDGEETISSQVSASSSACKFHVICSEGGSCQTVCEGKCPKGKECVRVVRAVKGGGTDTTCQCVALDPLGPLSPVDPQ